MCRIGVLIPPANVTCEREYPGCAPAGYSFHFTRLARPEATLDASSLVRMHESAGDAADRLRAVEPAAIAYACTSGSFLSGAGAHAEIAGQIRERTGIPAVTTATAVLQGLKAIGARRVAVYTPYPPDITASAVAFLAAHGLEIPAVDSHGCTQSRQVPAIAPQAVAERVGALVRPGIDAVFISCTNLGTLAVIEDLEKRHNLPVVSSNTATLWAVLRLAGCTDDIPRIGRLGGMPAARSAAG
jgi:Maleate cis-trans isomerase